MSRKFQVTAERGNGVWVLESDLGAVSQVRRLDQAADEMREALAYLAGLPEEEVEVEVVPVLPTAYIEAARRSEELRAAAAAAQQEAAASAREAARALLAAGLSTRDAALVMGVSHQRVAQLAANAA
ncbi:MAG TPA: hypothetical protein PKY27_06405 [Arachnia sp.]|jgi:DNA-binding CsgD family transcriptional regulator|nr:hypothetical protein [Arachnia sp.]HQD21871.1 hypothetical protein [Arachnia sp.]